MLTVVEGVSCSNDEDGDGDEDLVSAMGMNFPVTAMAFCGGRTTIGGETVPLLPPAAASVGVEALTQTFGGRYWIAAPLPPVG